MRKLLLSLLLFALAALAPPARADDTTPPVLSHTPVTKASPGPVAISVSVTSPRKVFPQVFWRVKGGPWKAPIDLKKAKGGHYEGTLTLGNEPLEYYIECYDEIGNGPARVGEVDKPILLTSGTAAPAPAPVATTPPPAPPAPVAKAEPPPKPAPAPVVATVQAEPVKERPPAPVAAVRADMPRSYGDISAGTATWHSAVLPGWGQFGTDRKLRGGTFAALAATGVVSSILLAVRANDANNIYESAGLVAKQAAWDQAVSYQKARDWAIGLTVAVWAINVAEAYLAYGTKDPF